MLKNNRTVGRLSAFALASALSLGIVAPAFAQTSTSTTPTSTTQTTTDARPTRSEPTAAQQADREAKELARKTDLASRLGISVTVIDSAQKTLAKEKVDAAVSAGTITAAEGATLKTQIDAGTKVRVPHGPRPATEPTAAERKAESDARLTKLVSLLGVTKDQYVKAVTDQAKADVAADLTAGNITSSQASARTALIDANAAAGEISGHGGHGGPGFGGPGGRGGSR